MSRRAIVESTSRYANGMFLWARLLVEYLQSDALTIQDRLDALDNLVFLEGLDRLYCAIFQSIVEKNPARAIQHIRRMFQLAVSAMRPLRLTEFRTALATPSCGHGSCFDTIPNLEENIGRVSGALLEIYSDKTIRLVHTSVAEYLLGSRNVLEASPTSNLNKFLFLRNEAHSVLAATCLSYFCQQIPPGPLSTDSQVTPDRQLQDKKYPFLHYSLQFWVAHACEGFGDSTCELFDNNMKDTAVGILLTWLTDFMRNKIYVSKWIEASFLFGITPTLNRLLIKFKCLRDTSMDDGRHTQQLGRITSELEEFTLDLQTLNERWTHVLRVTPNEIWEPSIPTFTKSNFWVGTKEAKLSSLATHGSLPSSLIVIQSQVSNSGLEVGLIKLLPSM